VQEQLEQLDSIFGPSYFEHGRLVVTVARDLTGCMKVAHKIMSKVSESFGAMVDVVTEHVKHEHWVKLREHTSQAGLAPGGEMPDYQVTKIPDGIRVAPYAREQLPTLEFLLLWEDASGRTRGHCLYTMAHPEVPAVEQVDEIFAALEPYFAKRWLHVELALGQPVRGEFEEPLPEEAEEALGSALVGPDVGVTVLALHPFGHARDARNGKIAHVSQCAPLVFTGVTDNAGTAKICFVPAEMNKIQVAETARFHGIDVHLPKSELTEQQSRPTMITLTLNPKAQAAVTVHVFAQPSRLPAADESGLIDWAEEQRQALTSACVEMVDGKEGAEPMQLAHAGEDRFVVEAGDLADGCISLVVSCEGYKTEERAVMLLVGSNEFYVPLSREA